MELDKRKYKRNEVVAMCNAYRKRYEELISEQKNKIIELAKENTNLRAELESYRQKEKLVYQTLESAEKRAEQVRELAQEEYALEVERLKKFSKKWNDYFEELEQKYPRYKIVKKAVEINKKVKNSVSGKNSKKVIDEIDAMISNNKTDNKTDEFNPKKKIAEYIVATQDGGFNMNEVLNPGEIKLEDICKELGLMGEKE